MIKDFERCGDELRWISGNKQHQKVLAGGTYINDEKHILIMDEHRERVIVLDESGRQLEELSNSDALYLMYLQKHPRFGLSVVASIKDPQGNWSDKYLSFATNKFELVLNSK